MKLILLIVLIFNISNIYSQSDNKVITSDIDHFWTAYDSIQNTNEHSKKIALINKLYIDKASKGLKAFMKVRDYSDSLYIELIDKCPKFWNSIRPNTLSIKNKTDELNNAVDNLKKLYPELKDAKMYFTIGGLRSGGTVSENMVLVGAEIATGNPDTDVSEFKNDWLKNVFAKQSLDNIVYFNIHEYIHTQQKPNNSSQLLNQAIKEGSCDFITELVLNQPIQRQYISYGNLHFDKLKEQFKKEMFSSYYANWLYNGGQKGESADLGYFIGYEICKSYYQQTENKEQAIKDIIELDYSNDKEVEQFLKKSGFYKRINKRKLIKQYEKEQPYIVKIEPFENGADNVDSKTKEFRITFSKKMSSKDYSINYSEKGKDHYPIKKVIGFENDDKTFVVSIELQPEKEYEFIITNNGFRSKDGHPLKEKEYIVKFKTE